MNGDRTPNNKDRNLTKILTPSKGIWIPESGKLLLVESGILRFGIQNKAQGIRNPNSTDKVWNAVPGIRNRQRGIWNPRLSWIPLHGAKNTFVHFIRKHCPFWGPKQQFYYYVHQSHRIKIYFFSVLYHRFIVLVRFTLYSKFLSTYNKSHQKSRASVSVLQEFIPWTCLFYLRFHGRQKTLKWSQRKEPRNMIENWSVLLSSVGQPLVQSHYRHPEIKVTNANMCKCISLIQTLTQTCPIKSVH